MAENDINLRLAQTADVITPERVLTTTDSGEAAAADGGQSGDVADDEGTESEETEESESEADDDVDDAYHD